MRQRLLLRNTGIWKLRGFTALKRAIHREQKKLKLLLMVNCSVAFFNDFLKISRNTLSCYKKCIKKDFNNNHSIIDWNNPELKNIYTFSCLRYLI